jgi:hypothetical protein
MDAKRGKWVTNWLRREKKTQSKKTFGHARVTNPTLATSRRNAELTKFT